MPGMGGNKPGGGGPSAGGKGDKGGGKGVLHIVKIVGATIIVFVALGLFAFRGCSFDFANIIPGIQNVVAGTGITNSSTPAGQLLSSKHTDASDRQNYAIIRDGSGVEYTTVIKIIPNHSLSTSVTDLKNRVANYRWYQMIAGNNMGTPTQTEALLYFPADMPVSDIMNIAGSLSADGVYTAIVMTPADYNGYLGDAKRNDLYYNETTYFGPAALS